MPTLDVQVVEARGLTAKDASGTSDPYVTIKVNKKSKVKTKVISKNLNPKWLESFSFGDVQEASQVCIRVWDKDLIGKDFMGEVVINLNELSSKNEDKWYFLRERKHRIHDEVSGQIHLVINWNGKIKESGSQPVENVSKSSKVVSNEDHPALIDVAHSYAVQAVALDEQGHYEQAVAMYQQAADNLKFVVNMLHDLELKKTLGDRITDYLNRVEDLKVEIGNQRAKEKELRRKERKEKKEKKEKLRNSSSKPEPTPSESKKETPQSQPVVETRPSSATKPQTPSTPANRRPLRVQESVSLLPNLQSGLKKNPKELARAPTRKQFTITRQATVNCSFRLTSSMNLRHDSQYEQILKQCRANGTKFTDSEFPPETKSLFKDLSNVPAEKNVVKSWRRLSEMAEKPMLFVDGVEPGDVIQGGLGDCWFLGPLSVIADKSALLMKIFIATSYVEEGVYAFRFFKNNKWTTVIVDDYIPCLANGKPAYGHCLNPNEIWVPLVEKAYAKLHSSYSAIEKGSESAAFLDLTGGLPEEKQLGKSIQKVDVFNYLSNSLKDGHLVGCSMITQGDRNGIMANHAYGILETRVKNNLKLIKLRNPWGQSEWTGDWSDKSKLWTPEMKKEFKLVDANDGCFWMCEEDFTQHFNAYYKCTLFGENMKKASVSGEWKGVTAGGCTNQSSWRMNPQYHLSLQKSTTVFVMLTQPEIRAKERKQYHHIGFYIIKALDKTAKRISLPADEIIHGHKFVDSRDVTAELELEAGEYVIIPCTFKPGVEIPFFLNVYSEGNPTLTPCIDWKISAVDGEWSKSKGNAGGCPNYPSWRENSQYLFKLTKQDTVSIILDKLENQDDLFLGFYVVKCDENGGKVTSLKQKVGVATYTNTEVNLTLQLQPGTYAVIPTSFEPGDEGKFVLLVCNQSERLAIQTLL